MTTQRSLSRDGLKTIDVYVEEDFGVTALVDGETRRILEYKNYVIHGNVNVSIPFHLSDFPGVDPFLDWMVFSSVGDLGAKIIYNDLDNGIPLFYGRDVGFVYFSEIIILGGQAGPNPTGILFDLEFFSSPNSTTRFNNAGFFNFANLGRLVGSEPIWNAVSIGEYLQGLVVQSNPLNGRITIADVICTQEALVSPTAMFSFSTPEGTPDTMDLSFVAGSLDLVAGNSVFNLSIGIDLDQISISNLTFDGPEDFFRQNTLLNILTVADSPVNPGTEIRLTIDVTHPYQEFDDVLIGNTTSYDGQVRVVRRVNDTTFDIPGTFVASETGTTIGISLNQTNIDVLITDCGVQANSRVIGAASWNGNGLNTTVSSNAYENLLLSNFVLGPTQERFIINNILTGELTYIGERPFKGLLSMTMHTSLVTTNNDYRFTVSINQAVPIFDSEPGPYATLSLKSVGDRVTILIPIELQTGDDVKMMIAGISNSINLNLLEGSINIQ